MKWTTRLLFLLAISLAGAVIAMVSDQRTRTPESALDSISAIIEGDDFNHDTVLRSLDGALSESRSSGDHALLVRALTLRGDLLLKIGAAEAARTDFEEIRLVQGTEDEELLLRLIETDILAGDPDSGQRRIESVLNINPDSAQAYVLQGRLYQASAKQRTDQCDEILRETLVHDESVMASALVDRLAAQDLLDPHRAGVVSSLREFFTGSDAERLARVLVHSDTASLYSRKARASYEASFIRGSDPLGAYGYITLLLRADRPDKAIRFGAQIRKRAEISSHHPTSLQLIRAHLRAGDGDGAGTLAAELIQATRDLTPSEYGDCCRALLVSQRWSGLFHAASRMRTIGTSTDSATASLYLGFAQKGRKRFTNARNLLRSFATSNAPAPYPTAHFEAWTTLAELDKAAEEPFFEREAIHAALQLDPDGHNSSQLWVRLGELQLSSGHSGFLLPLRSYAEALCRAPKQYTEIFQRFEEIGEEAVAVEGRDLELIYQDLIRERRSTPSIPLDSYSLLHLARRHAQEDNYLAVVSVCRRLLDNLPAFLPAIDLMIDARLNLGRTRTATEQIVERIDTIGLDSTSQEFVRRLPSAPYSTSQLHRVMRADPAWTGRLEIARRMRAEGNRRRALTCLEEAAGKGKISSEIRLLSAKIYAEIGEREAALEQLSLIAASDPDFTEAMLLSVQVASLSGDMDAIDTATTTLLDSKDVALLRVLADRLLFDRRIAKVSPILDALKDLSGEDDAWSLEHSVLFHLIRGDVRKTREAAARAEAFSTSPLPPLGLTLASTIAADPQRLANESSYLLELFPKFSRRGALDWKRSVEGEVSEAILALFSGDSERTRALLDDALLREDVPPEWALVAVGYEALGHELGEHSWRDDELAHARRLIHGSTEEPRDPRTALGVLLASKTSFYAPYALEKLNQYTDGERSAWDAYLIAKTLLTGGEMLRARNALWGWVQPDSDYFSPAWDLFEQIELSRLGSFDHPDFDTLRIAKLRSQGKAYPKSPEAKLARCYDALDAGDLEAANQAARAAHGLDQTDHLANATMARATAATGDHYESLNYWLIACENAPPSHRSRYVTGALDSFHVSISASGKDLLPSVYAGVLESLSRFSPRDPRIPLALAHIDLRQDLDNPALGVARAFRRLDNFLRTVDEEALADLQPGTENEWLAFYMQYGPERGLEFCRSQLTLSPGVLALWLGEVRALHALGRHQDSLKAAADLLRMGPSGELYEEIAACLQATGSAPKQVEAQLEKAKGMSGGLSVGAMLTRTKSLLGVKGERTADQAIAVLARVWDQKSTGPLSPMQSEVALLLSEGFMKRGKPNDYRQARLLLSQVTERAQDPYAASLAAALAGICTQELP